MKRRIIVALWLASVFAVSYITVEAASWCNFHLSGGASPEFSQSLKLIMMLSLISVALGRYAWLRMKTVKVRNLAGSDDH